MRRDVGVDVVLTDGWGYSIFDVREELPDARV
jgi:hypothetical protein